MNLNAYYIPDFRVMINGNKIPNTLRAVISSVSFTTGLEGADRVELSIANLARTWVDDPLLEVRNENPQLLTLFLGYQPHGLEQMFVGEITGLNASFPSSGVPQLTVAAQDKRHRMKLAKRNTMQSTPSGQGNKPISDRQITDDIGKRFGLDVRRDDTRGKLGPLIDAAAQLGLGGDPDSQQKGTRRQANETDYDLLHRIARDSGWEMLIDHTPEGQGKILRFLFPPANTKADLYLEYGQSLMEFTPKESIVGQIRSVSTSLKVSATGVKQAMKLEVNNDLTELKLTITPNPPAPKAGVQAEDSVVIQEPLTPDTAPRRLLGEILTRTNQRLTGSGSTIGDTRIRAGSVLQLGGMGLRFGGLYRVTSATHTIDGSGYKTKFDVRKEIGLNGLQTSVQGAKPAKKPATASS